VERDLSTVAIWADSRRQAAEFEKIAIWRIVT
jgi:hypothetical protein